MIDWYYHDPAQGRVGPYTPEQMRARFRDRMIQRDTLVWHAGLREWQPLDRQSEALALDGVTPDMSLPPPMPPMQPALAGTASRATASSASRHARRGSGESRRGLSGCAIVAIVVAALTIPVGGILAAIAIPAYRDYTVRAKTMTGVAGTAPAIQALVASHLEQTGRCPGNDEMAQTIRSFQASHPSSGLRFGSVESGNCAFEFTVGGVSPKVDGSTLLYVAYDEGDELAWDCTGGTLPARYRRPACRAVDQPASP